jgi:hypothetical protein
MSRHKLLILLPALLVFSIPWYWPDGLIRPFLLGLPLWVFASFFASFLFASVTAWLILRHWEDE